MTSELKCSVCNCSCKDFQHNGRWHCGKPIKLKEMPIHVKCENERRRIPNKRGYYGGFQWEILPE